MQGGKVIFHRKPSPNFLSFGAGLNEDAGRLDEAVPVQVHERALDEHELVVDEQRLQRPALHRITSYNVCYTKLLRAWRPCSGW